MFTIDKNQCSRSQEYPAVSTEPELPSDKSGSEDITVIEISPPITIPLTEQLSDLGISESDLGRPRADSGLSREDQKKLKESLAKLHQMNAPTIYTPSTEEQELRNTICQELVKYTERVGNHLDVEKYSDDFFWIGKYSRGLNRMANYELAMDCIDRLNKNQPLDEIFGELSDMKKRRIDLMRDKRPALSEAFLSNDHGINSDDLNKVLKRGQSFKPKDSQWVLGEP